jgi:hypothetical protein
MQCILQYIFLTTHRYTILLWGVIKMTFILKNDRRETGNKTIRFPLELINEIEKAIEGTEINFSRFVIQACQYALSEMDKKEKKEETHS